VSQIDNIGLVTASDRVATRKILVTVGTDHHRFDRLISWFDDWVAEQTVADHIEGFVQRGTSPPGKVESSDYLDFSALRQRIRASEVVVTHGGPGSIMECRRWGLLPIVCPRDPNHGEHVDNHQQLFSRRLAAQGQILLAETKIDLFGLLDSMTVEPQFVSHSDDRHIERAVGRVARVIDRLVGNDATSWQTKEPRT